MKVLDHFAVRGASCAAALLLTVLSWTPAQAQSARRMAITIDDLPFNCTCSELAEFRHLARGLIRALGRHRAPAVGFVNEIKLYPELDSWRRSTPLPQDLPAPSTERVALIEAWLEAGLELGNHTFSHPDLHGTPLEDFQQEVLRGEAVTRELIDEHAGQLRWFRHPFLHTGRELATKRQLERFLLEHGYRIAPVTIDNSEWIYARAYDVARDRESTAPGSELRREAKELAQRVVDAYLDYMVEQTSFFEAQSRTLLAREIPQVLLLHANRLNAVALDELLDRLASRGYRFVTLDEVLEDPAYDREDRYTGPAGMSWIQRWAWTAGHRGTWFAGEPEVEAWVRELSGL